MYTYDDKNMMHVLALPYIYTHSISKNYRMAFLYDGWSSNTHKIWWGSTELNRAIFPFLQHLAIFYENQR